MRFPLGECFVAGFLILFFTASVDQALASPEIGPSSDAVIDEPDPTSLLLAADKKKKKKKKKKSKSAAEPVTEEEGGTKEGAADTAATTAKSAGPRFGIRGLVGPELGTDREETLLTFGGDAIYYIIPAISAQAGGLYGMYSAETELVSIAASVLILDLGAYYHWRPIPLLSLDGGFRFGQFTFSIATDSELGLVEDSSSALLASIAVGSTFYFGMFSAGAEVRKAVYVASEDIEAEGFNLLGSAGIAF
jgi:hypothetical protein